MFIGLNPSTADETKDDPTIRRCINYAKRWGYSGLCMTNLFALRATKPAVMKANPGPVGRENDYQIQENITKHEYECEAYIPDWRDPEADIYYDR